MLLHISIPAKNTEKVANVLAELCQGKVKKFKPLANAFMVYANDEFGSGFEVYPEDILLKPGIEHEEPSRFVEQQQFDLHSTTHCAIRTPLSGDEILAIAEREGWRCFYTRRQDLFSLYEFWLENRFLLELIIDSDWPEAKKCLRLT